MASPTVPKLHIDDKKLENSKKTRYMAYASKVIEPSRGWVGINFAELWRYRELLYFLTWRDVSIKYKQAIIGIGWVVLQPLLTMVIFSVIFGQLAKLPSDGKPYPVFSFAGILPWQLFAFGLQRAGASLVVHTSLITKVYFPRLLIPLAAVFGGLVDFGISFVVLLLLMAYFGIMPTVAIFWLPVFTVFVLLFTVAIALWLSALNALFRDVQYILPFLVQAWMFISPVGYSQDLVPAGTWRLVYGLNPMAGAIQGFRWALLGSHAPDKLMAVSLIVLIVLLVSGLFFFRRMERKFADVI